MADPLAMMLGVPALLLASYLLGSVPFGLVITRALGLGDLRQIGSGNIGATNVLRTGHRGAAAATLILDAGKGAMAVGLAWAVGLGVAAPVAGLAAFAGHVYPVWLYFRGGKGVATFLGTVLALAPLAGLLTCLTWVAVAAITRISSAGALGAAAFAPLWLWLTGAIEAAPAVILMTLLIVVSHRANIARLRRGEEPRITLRRGGSR